MTLPGGGTDTPHRVDTCPFPQTSGHHWTNAQPSTKSHPPSHMHWQGLDLVHAHISPPPPRPPLGTHRLAPGAEAQWRQEGVIHHLAAVHIHR